MLATLIDRHFDYEGTFGILMTNMKSINDLPRAYTSSATAKKVKSIQDLPDWFHLDNYLKESYSNKELRFQVFNFSLLINSLNDQTFDKSGSELSGSALIDFKSTENTEISFVDSAQAECVNKLDVLPSSPSIHPIDLGCILWMAEEISNHYGEKRFSDIKWKYQDIVYSYDTKYNPDKSLHLSLDLNKSDFHILQELKAQLPLYRTQLKAKESKIKFRQSDINKIREYRILPLLDLHVWALKSGKEIAHSVLSKAIFSDIEKGEEDIRKTILPFMEKVTTVGFLSDWASADYATENLNRKL